MNAPKAKSQRRRVTERVPITEETLEALREFKSGMKMTYEEVITWLLEQQRPSGKGDWYIIGRKIRTGNKETA